MTMKAGKYWLGDPYYVVNKKNNPALSWDDFCFEQWISTTGEVTILGEKCIVFNTKHGDGIYITNNGLSCPVDSGMIGLVPVSLVGENPPESWGNTLITFENDFECFNTDGILYFGHIEIDTDYQEDEEEENGPCYECGHFDCYGECVDADVDDEE